MPDTDGDPRHKGFTGFSLRPSPKPADEEPSHPTAPRRGIAGPPPPKPTVGVPPAEIASAPAALPIAAPAVPAVPVVARTPKPRAVRDPLPQEVIEQRPLGVQRHHMRYVQFQVSPAVSDLLTSRAQQEDVVLGEIVMDALRHLEAHPAPEGSGRRRRRSSTAARRSILVRPQEADDISVMAERLGVTPSALIRTALERYLL